MHFPLKFQYNIFKGRNEKRFSQQETNFSHLYVNISSAHVQKHEFWENSDTFVWSHVFLFTSFLLVSGVSRLANAGHESDLITIWGTFTIVQLSTNLLIQIISVKWEPVLAT